MVGRWLNGPEPGTRVVRGRGWPLLAALATAAVWAQTAPEEKTVTVERKTMAEADRDAAKYHTREGRLAAKPLDWNANLGKRTAPQKEPTGKAAVRPEPGTAKAGDPHPQARQEAQKLYPDDWKRTHEPASQPLSDARLDPPLRFIRTSGSPDVFTQYGEGPPLMDQNARQEKIGKLFLNGGYCSASVVSGNNVIVTAAHCCYDRGQKKWTGGWVFAPAYNNGNAPYGTFNWLTATILTRWISNGDIAADVCAIKLQDDRAGHGVSFYVGWLGRSWNWPSDQELHSAGYPGNLGGGNLLQVCTAESFSPTSSCGGGDVFNMGCSMTFGSSGGPWIRHYRSDDWVNAVVHGYDSQSCTGSFGSTFNGPRFTSSNIVPVCSAAGC